MPLCLIQSLPGTVHKLTDSLSIAIPDASTEMSFSVPVSCCKEVREGRCAWHAHSTPSTDPVSIDTLAAFCTQWRERGLFSFIEVRGSPDGAEKEVQRISRAVDWLIVDGTLERTERWSQLVQPFRQLTRKVGVRLKLKESSHAHDEAFWIAQLALQLGEPGFLFIEGSTVEESVASVRNVQDLLSRHPLSRGSARLIPILQPKDHSVGDVSIELLDFPSLDALVIESMRSFFGGAAVGEGKGEPLFGRSLWQMVVCMIAERRSTASLCHYEGLPRALELMRGAYALGEAFPREECREALAHLEKLLREIDQELVFGDEKIAVLRERIGALIAQAQETVGQRLPKRTVFV